MVPIRNQEHWAYTGDSMARGGFEGKNHPKNTDIGTQITEFSGGKIRFDNYGRDSNTTAGMVGKQTIRGKRKNTMGRILEGNYDGILIEIGVNELGGSQEHWIAQAIRTQKNIVEMYVMAYVSQEGGARREEVLGRIDGMLSEIHAEKVELLKQLDTGWAKKSGIARLRMEEKMASLSERGEILKVARKKYLRLAKRARAPKPGVKRIVFVEAAPWKELGATTPRARKIALRTEEYNGMLVELGDELNAVFGPIGGPKFEVAKIHNVLESPEDHGVLYSRYVGRNKNGRDYLHFGKRGREAAAAAITLQVFPEYAQNPSRLKSICIQNRTGKRSGILARR